MKTKTAVIEDVRKTSVRNFDMPEPGPDEVLVKIHACNICTTDWQTWAGLRASRKPQFPFAPGHEMAGEIVATGSAVRPDLKIGDHVAFGHMGCGECYFCRAGKMARCQHRIGRLILDGVPGSFGMGQYLVAKTSRVYKINPNLPYEEAGYLEPVATAIHGNRRLRVKPGEDVLVIGAGNLGLVNAQVARAFGARVMVSEILPERVELARALGFPTVNPAHEDIVKVTMDFTDGKGMDAVILAVGSTKANEQALSVIGLTGRVLFFAAGYPQPELRVDPNTIHYREWELIGAMSAAPEDFQLSAKYLSEGIVKTGNLISYKISLNDVQHAFELAATPGNYRVSVVMW